MIKITGSLTPCPKCLKQPKMYMRLGKNTISLQCNPCSLTTGEFDSSQAAVAAWEKMADQLATVSP